MNDTVWRLAYGAVGLLVGLLLFVFLMGASNVVPTIICPPMIDAADAVILHYPPDGGPQPTELDYEFAEACGFEMIKGPVKIQPPEPPLPEEGGA